MKEILINNIDKIHTTNMGKKRIKNNLKMDEDVILFCKEILLNKESIVFKNGKNYYLKYKNIIITINSYSYTIITAHLVKEKLNCLF